MEYKKCQGKVNFKQKTFGTNTYNVNVPKVLESLKLDYSPQKRILPWYEMGDNATKYQSRKQKH